MKIEKMIRNLGQQLQHAAPPSVGLHALAHGWLGLRSLLGAAHILGVFYSVPVGRLAHGRGLLLGRRHKFA